MQRIAPNTMPPRGGSGGRQGSVGGAGESPAYRMASRIRAEQGPERAAQYLRAMEPFLAPAERSHIAQQLGLRVPAPPSAQPAQPAQPAASNQPPLSGMPGLDGGAMPNIGNMGNMGPLGNIGNMGTGPLGNIGNIMQMMQLFQGLSAGNAGGSAGGNPLGGLGGGNPMQLAQMLGSLMGGKKN